MVWAADRPSQRNTWTSRCSPWCHTFCDSFSHAPLAVSFGGSYVRASWISAAGHDNHGSFRLLLVFVSLSSTVLVQSDLPAIEEQDDIPRNILRRVWKLGSIAQGREKQCWSELVSVYLTATPTSFVSTTGSWCARGSHKRWDRDQNY